MRVRPATGDSTESQAPSESAAAMSDPAEPAAPLPASPIDDGDSAEPIFFTGPEADRVGPRIAPRGPGLRESLLWIGGFFALELFGSMAWQVGILGYQMAARGMDRPPDAETLQAMLNDALPAAMPWMIGSLKLIEVLAALLAIRLRFGPSAFRVTGFGRFPLLHAAILFFAVVPAAYLSGQCFALFTAGWDWLARFFPVLSELSKLSSIELVQKMAETTPLWVLVLIIAVGPALNEEFVFRAAVGRGLLARYRLVVGVAITSVLFAVVHLSPVHAAALLPLAVLLHVGYYSSGSIWMPVGVHLLNNALSVVMMKLATIPPEQGGISPEVADAPFSPLLFAASAACVAATVWLLMTLRVRWRLPDGSEWRPVETSVEPPPPAVPATRFIGWPPISAALTTGLCYLAFPVALVVETLRQQG